MSEFKPVRLILQGDKELAATHKGDAGRILFQLKNLQDAGGFTQRAAKQYQDGTVIECRTDVKGMDIVKITSNRVFNPNVEQQPVKEEKTRIETIKFPVPVIGVTDDYETLTPIGGYIAKNFMGFRKEYSDKYKEEYIEKYDAVKKGVSYGVKGIGYGQTVELKSLMAVGDHTSFESNYEYSKSYWHTPIDRGYMSDHSITGECSGEYGDFTVMFDASDNPINAPIPITVGTQVGNDDPNRYNHLNVYTTTAFLPEESFEVLDIWGDFFFYGCCTWAIPPWVCTKVVSTPQIGIYASGSWEYSIDGTFNSSYKTTIKCGSWEKEGVLTRKGNGNVSVDCLYGEMRYYSSTVDSGFKLDGFDGAVWRDLLDTERIACLYEYNDSSHLYSYAGGDSVNPGRIGIVCGDLDHWDHLGHRIQYYFKTDEDEFIINDLSYFEYEFAYGAVEIFDYNGNPVYVYQIYYTLDYSKPDGSIFEYGFVYKRKLHRIRFNGLGDGNLDYSEWAHDLLSGIYIDPEGIEKSIETSKNLEGFYGGVIDYSTYNWSMMPFMVSEYIVTEQYKEI